MDSWKVFAFFMAGIVALAITGVMTLSFAGRPKLTVHGRGYVYEHVPYPPCPNDMKRTCGNS